MDWSNALSLLDRMVLAVERVRERLSRAAKALESREVPYAVAGENAVAYWVSTIDPGAIRNTPSVEIILQRRDQVVAARALEDAGFVQSLEQPDAFVDGQHANLRDAVEIFWRVALPESVRTDQFRVIELNPLVNMLLERFRLVDKVCLREMLDVALIDQSWVSRFPPELGARLQQLIDTPEG